MSTPALYPHSTAEQAFQVVELLDMALMAKSFGELKDSVLPNVAIMTQSPVALLYIADPRLPGPRFIQHGFASKATSGIENLCAEQFSRISSQPGAQSLLVSAPLSWGVGANLIFYPLRNYERCFGLVGLTADGDTTPIPQEVWERLLRSLANVISRLAGCMESERQLLHLNTYLTVSSMLAQSLDLHKLLEVALYCCMDAVSAEAASVLLLDDDKENFKFYEVEGPAKPILMSATFPVDRGLAGSILQTQQSEIINDVHNDPRFYKRVDSESGFETWNMIAIPLTAGEERVGVLEVLNKTSGDSFTEEERLLLVSIAEEIAFAIRNAMVFEYVVNTYCKQRQGQISCKGCKRPLGSWTPCVKYRETADTIQTA